MKRFILAALAAAIISCVDVAQDQVVNAPPATPPATPAASPTPNSTPPPVATVAVVEYGRDGTACGSGTNLPVTGCVALITCTPRDAGSVDVGPRYVPAWNAAGALGVNPTSTNIYNARAGCTSGGTGIISCEVGGKSGSIQYNCVP